MIRRRGLILAGLAAPLLARGQVRELAGSAGQGDTAAIQVAVDALAGTGGTLVLPGRFRITAPIVVRSEHPINLVGTAAGHMHGNQHAPQGLILAADIDGPMIRYVAPKNRGTHGGGAVRGLNFYDETGSGATPGKFRCTAALELIDFSLSTVEDCTFQWINGSAIYGEFVVMSTLRNNRIRYCGARGRPAVWFPADHPAYTLQGTDLIGNKVEVCHVESYMEIGPKSADCKFIGNGFETDTSVVSSNHEFLTLRGNAHQVTGNHFNRNTGTQLTLAGQSCSVMANAFRGGAFPATALNVTGHHNALTGNAFASIRTGLEVDLSGPFNIFSANNMYYSGAVRIAGAGCSATGNVLNGCTGQPEVLGRDNEWWIQDHPRAVGSVISNNVLSNQPGRVRTTGGIVLRGSGASCQGNTFHGFNGSGNGGVCIQVESPSASVGINSEVSSSTLLRRVASRP